MDVITVNWKRPTIWVIGLTLIICGAIMVLFLTNPKDETSGAYHLEELEEFFAGRCVDDSLRMDGYQEILNMEEVNKYFPVENIRSYKYEEVLVTSYTVYPVKEGGCYYVFWSVSGDGETRKVESNSSVYDTTYIAAPTRDASLFDSIKSGISTAGDVEAIDPYVYMEFTRGSGTFSLSYLDSENVLEVEYDPETIEEISDYKNMIVNSVKVRPCTYYYPYGYISQDDLPNREFEEGKHLKEESDIIHTYYATLHEDWEEQQEKGMPVFFTTHYELSDGTWATGERCYKYRLDLRGNVDDADTTYRFILLSNTKEITFEQALEQWSLHNNSDAYFHPDDSIIVGIEYPHS